MLCVEISAVHKGDSPTFQQRFGGMAKCFLLKPLFLDLLNTLHLSFATISQLELLFNRKTQSTKGSVFEAINRTVTTGGRQMLRSWLQSPSAEEVGLEGRWKVGDD